MSDYIEANVTEDANATINSKLRQVFDGRIVRKDLTKKIKDDEVLKKIPVYLFSSLINEQMRIKGESVGADAQFSKPQIGNLINYINEHI